MPGGPQQQPQNPHETTAREASESRVLVILMEMFQEERGNSFS